jgi:hypothetical protein
MHLLKSVLPCNKQFVSLQYNAENLNDILPLLSVSKELLHDVLGYMTGCFAMH